MHNAKSYEGIRIRFRLIITLSAARLLVPSRKASIPSMFLITPIQAAAVIAGNCLFGKAFMTIRWRWLGANKFLDGKNKSPDSDWSDSR